MRRTVCVMTPVELRILGNRWGYEKTLIEVVRLEEIRQAEEDRRQVGLLRRLRGKGK